MPRRRIRPDALKVELARAAPLLVVVGVVMMNLLIDFL
jgi:hypothetical protein